MSITYDLSEPLDALIQRFEDAKNKKPVPENMGVQPESFQRQENTLYFLVNSFNQNPLTIKYYPDSKTLCVNVDGNSYCSYISEGKLEFPPDAKRIEFIDDAPGKLYGKR